MNYAKQNQRLLSDRVTYKHIIVKASLFGLLVAIWFYGGHHLIRAMADTFSEHEYLETWSQGLFMLLSTAFVLTILKQDAQSTNDWRHAVEVNADYYRQFFESAPIAYQALDQNACITEVNKAWETLTGYSSDEVIGVEVRTIIAPETIPAFEEVLTEFLAGKPNNNIELQMIRKDGSIIDIRAESNICQFPCIEQLAQPCTYSYCAVFDVTEKKHTELKLKTSEQRLHMALDNVSDGLWDWQVHSGEVYYSPVWFTELGYVPDELGHTFQTWVDLLHPDDSELVLSVLKMHLDDKSPEYVIDHRLKTKDGQWKWILTRGKVVERDEQGRAVRMIGTHVDIDQRKKLEQRLVASEERFHLAAVAGHVAAWEALPLQGRLIGHSSLFRLTGYSSDETGDRLRRWLKLIVAEDRHLIINELRQIWQNKKSELSLDLRFKHKDGRIIWLYCKGSCTIHETFEDVKILGVCTDITEHKNAEMTILKERQRAEGYLELVDVMVLALDTEGKINLLNRKGYEILGYEYGSLTHVNWFDVCLPDDIRDEVKHVFAVICKGGKEFTDSIENEVLAKDGSTRLIAWHNTLVFDEDGEVIGTLSSGIDISEERQSQIERDRLHRELTQVQKVEAVGRLTGGIVHDFNNIMSSILGYTGLAIDRYAQQCPEKLGEYMDEVLIAGERARDLVAQLLRFSRRGSGYEPQRLNLIPLINEVVKMINAPMTSVIQINLNLDPHTPSVFVDATQVHQVLLNLCINARDAMDGHGVICISLKKRVFKSVQCTNCHKPIAGEWIGITVTDTGKGIHKEDMNKIFEPFFTTKEQGKGTGIGLSVSQNIMLQHNGHIYVQSEYGKGTSFHLLFPVIHKDTMHVSKKSLPVSFKQKPTDISGNILVIDDEHSLAVYISELLTLYGYTVKIMHNPVDALAYFQTMPDAFDLVISDQTMPEMLGLELLQRMLSIKPELPTILYSGYTETMDEKQAKAMGISCFIAKPVEPKKFMDTIWKLVVRQDKDIC